VVEIATVQNRFNVVDRDIEAVLDACERHDIGFVPWFPLGAGDLDARGADLDAVAADHDATRYQVALAWLLHRSPVTLPIPGTSRVEHLERNVEAADIELSDRDMSKLA
jgi:aryl-alcohol dehydrogenase-like predicted oxidoreductase